LYSESGKMVGGRSTSFTAPGMQADVVLEKYRKQLMWVDAQLGAWLDRIRKSGVYDTATLVITSDHGLRTRGAFEPETYPSSQSDFAPRIPLIIHSPGLAKGVNGIAYQHIDLCPTILDLLKVQYKAESFDGESILRPMAGKVRKFFAEDKEYVKDGPDKTWSTTIRH